MGCRILKVKVIVDAARRIEWCSALRAPICVHVLPDDEFCLAFTAQYCWFGSALRGPGLSLVIRGFVVALKTRIVPFTATKFQRHNI